jgi:hypothetical protein
MAGKVWLAEPVNCKPAPPQLQPCIGQIKPPRTDNGAEFLQSLEIAGEIALGRNRILGDVAYRWFCHFLPAQVQSPARFEYR